MTAIFIHLYYFDLWPEFRDALNKLSDPFDLYCNVVEKDGALELRSKIRKEFPRAQVFISPNECMDIGGQFRNIQEWIESGAQNDVIVFLHSKKSPHLQRTDTDGDLWRKALVSIIEPMNWKVAHEMFKNKKNVGIVCKKGYISSPNKWLQEWNFRARNIERMKWWVDKLGMELPDNYRFVGGTMFFARASFIAEYFSLFPPLLLLTMFEETDAAIDDSDAHIWERIFGIMAYNSGLNIEEL